MLGTVIPDTPVSASSGTISDMKINSLVSPLGIEGTPVFSWVINLPDEFGKVQNSYRIRVSLSLSGAQSDKADIWDSGTVPSDNTTSVTYSGQELTSKTTYFWTVESVVSGNKIKSSPAKFSTGIFAQNEWQGQWIGKDINSLNLNLIGAKWIWNTTTSAPEQIPAKDMYFRKIITPATGKTIKEVAIAFAADKSDFYLNASKLASTDFWNDGKLINITGNFVSGNNIVAFSVKNASKGYAGLIAKVQIKYADNSTDTIMTDNTWKLSPNLSTNWNTLSFDDSTWLVPSQQAAYGQNPWETNVSLNQSDSRAEVMLRKEFSVNSDKQVKEAYAYVCGLGLFEMTINGQKPDDSVLNPPYSQYDESVLYRTFDLTSLLQSGNNAIGVELGNGLYNDDIKVWNWHVANWRDSPKLRFNLVIKYEDNTSEIIVSDNTWKMTSDGPITSNSMYYGDTYDARKEQIDFDKPSFNDSNWTTPNIMAAPKGKLKSMMKAPIKKTDTFSPKEIKKLSNGSYIVTIPEMISGWAKLSGINEIAGTKIKITYGQALNSDGAVVKWGGKDGKNADWYPAAYTQQDNYICKGTGNETYEPKFSCKGGQYIQIDGFNGVLTTDKIEIYRITNDIKIVSDFETSDSSINYMHKRMVNSIANKFHGERCDPLIEKNGWLGDLNVSRYSSMYNFDMPGMLPGYIDIMEDGFNHYGIVPIMVPAANWGVENYPVWNTLLVNGVQDLDDFYGTKTYSAKQYAVMKAYVDKNIEYIRNNGWIWTDDGLADWVSPMGGTDPNMGYNETPSEGAGIVATAYVYKMLGTMKMLAERLGKSDDITYFNSAMTNIYKAFNNKFYKKINRYMKRTFGIK